MRRFLFFLLVLVSSCTGLDDDEPADNPVEVIEILLPQAQAALARTAGGEYVLYQSVFMQQIAGINGTVLDVDRYRINPSDLEKAWGIFYINVFSSLNTIIDYAEKAGLYKARGMARIMMANALGLVTSAWGDVPFTESFLIENVSLRPAYDTQELLYNTIFSLLAGGIEDMNSHGNQIFPLEQDKFFKGNKDKWIRLAEFLTLRYNLHLSGKKGYSDMISLLGNDMFPAPGERLEIKFSDLEEFSHPLYEFFLTSYGTAGAGLFIVNEMKEAMDPRLSAYFEPAESGHIEGSAPGEGNQAASSISSSYVSAGSGVVLASYTEQKFIEAEVYLESNMQTHAIAAFNEGLRSSLLDFNVFDEGWFQQNKAVEELTLEQLIDSKYIAMFLIPENWNDWRRTGFPLLEPATGNSTGNLIPRRFPYPESEYLFNVENVPSGIEITTPVWWDE